MRFKSDVGSSPPPFKRVVMLTPTLGWLKNREFKMINKFYKGIISLFFLTDFFIIYGIVLSVVFNKIKIMMSLTIVGRAVPIIWGVLFIIFLLGLIFYRHKIISFKEFIASIFVITLTCYLTYLCQFTHTPDIFTCDDLIWSTERIFLYFPKEYYWVILQGISYIISIIVKDKKNLKGLKINIVLFGSGGKSHLAPVGKSQFLTNEKNQNYPNQTSFLK